MLQRLSHCCPALCFSMLFTMAEPLPEKLPEGDAGIAARHREDGGISKDPAVLFADNFDDCGSAGELGKKWDYVHHPDHIGLEVETPEKRVGAKSLRCTVPAGQEVSVALGKKLPVEQDRLFFRFSIKFDGRFDAAGARSCHNGATVGAHYFRDGHASAGQRADGKNKFLVNFECESVYSGAGVPMPGKWNFYCYHPAQRDDYGDHIFPSGLVMPDTSVKADFGPSFVRRPELVPEPGRWYGAEFMVQANTPGKKDGRMAAWIDGKLLCDFPDLRLRDVETLKMDYVGLGLYLAGPTKQANAVHYDDVVIAKSYIGPLKRD